MQFHGCSGHRHASLWGRATWCAGLLGVPAGGDPPTVLLAAPLAFRAPSRLTVEPGCLACRRAAARPQYCLQHRWRSGHRHALLWSRAAWRAGGQRPARSIACSTAGVPGTVTPNCGAGLLSVPAGGGPPASRPRRELRSVRRLEARPGPATAHRHHNQAPPAPPTPAVLGMLTYGLAHHPDTPPSPTTAHRHRNQAPHDFWYCYVASRVFQAPPAPSTPVALGMPTYGLAHHPDTPPSPTTAHRHRNQAPHDFWYCYVASRVFQAPTSPLHELRPGTWTRLMVAVMRLAGGPDLGILPGSGP